MARKPSREEVELRAYEIYIERGAQDGHDAEDWIAAEEELSSPVASEPKTASSTATSAPQTTLHRSATAGSGDRR
ncbi:MAG TPA: DUF2934 domain-containing protein [Candidatus Acidoferrales bacterium]|nr:DUF2934 domain-containing protein [Candidatus Acidoferrales bacterium]